jgi:hypothetical protein
MTAVGYVVTTMTLKIGTVQYETAVLDVSLEATTATQTAVMASGEVLTDAGTPIWTVAGNANVSVATGSLYRILVAVAAGTTAAFEFVPDVVGNPTVKVSGTVVLMAPSAAFKPGDFATFPFSLPVVGQPTWA